MSDHQPQREVPALICVFAFIPNDAADMRASRSHSSRRRQSLTRAVSAHDVDEPPRREHRAALIKKPERPEREPALGIPVGGIGQWVATRVPTPPIRTALIRPSDTRATYCWGMLPTRRATPRSTTSGSDSTTSHSGTSSLRANRRFHLPRSVARSCPRTTRALGFYFDPTTVSAAENVAETFQVPIDLLKRNPVAQHACPAGVRIERVVPTSPLADIHPFPTASRMDR